MTQRNELVQGLGFYGAVSVVAGTMIGTAIFVVPSLMLQQTGTPLKVLGIWVVAGVLSLFGALGYAELGAALPEAGGEYVYLSQAYGRGMGFLYGWAQFIVAKTASIAAIATGFFLYAAYFFPGLAGTAWRLPLRVASHHWIIAFTGIQIGSAALILFLSGLNVLGVRRSGAVQTVFTAAKIVVLAVLVILAAVVGHGSWSHFRAAAVGSHVPGGVFAGFGLAMVSALWAYDGWNNLSMVGGEVANPQRNVPAALIAGALLVALVYILVNLAYFYVLAPHAAMNTRVIAAVTARRLIGPAGGTFIAIGVLISTFATLNGSILAGSRIPYAQARDRLFPRALGSVHPRFRTPAVAIAAQAVIAGVFALSGRYETLFTKAIYSEWVFYALVTAGIIVLRRRKPRLPRPYRTWGYPVVPVIFVVLAGALLAGAFFTSRSDALWCLGLIGSGIPIYFLWKLCTRTA
ncbi:MAG: APC family permease [Terriglobia bacterium]